MRKLARSNIEDVVVFGKWLQTVTAMAMLSIGPGGGALADGWYQDAMSGAALGAVATKANSESLPLGAGVAWGAAQEYALRLE